MHDAPSGPVREQDGYWLDLTAMEPFFMTLAGASDAWAFLSSTGGITAGRRSAEHALFPYETEDKITQSSAHTGGFTALTDTRGESGALPWLPLDPHARTVSGSRRLHKTALGDAITFEESNDDLGLTFSVTWRTSDEFGVVRQCELRDNRGEARTVSLVDGLLNLLPPGASVQVTRNLSNLLDAYKVTEVDPGTGLGVVYLNSLLTDLAEPAESLAATAVWQVGLPATDHLLSTRHLADVTRGLPVPGQQQVRGERAAFLTRCELALPAHGVHRWSVIADVDLDSAQLVDLRDLVADADTAAARVETSLEENRCRLRALVASADGLQCSGDPLAADHHLANVLFNIMRGGVFRDGYRLELDDVRDYLHTRNRAVLERFDALLPADVRADLSVQRLHDWAATTDDADLVRLLRGFLPLTFGRRHGDPSRPWNKFDIVVNGPDGRPRSDYQGNWRDIFQNWEALAWSFPGYLGGMISTFVDATTLDGYNPYRISRAGVDWETPDPEDPWANIGYWSDHQIVYLLALLETADAFSPGTVSEMLHQQVFTSADVPYRLADFDQMLVDPRETISFDEGAHDAARRRAALIGGDGLLAHDDQGSLVRSTLAEKLLLLLCAKLVNLVPRGGIWMNTQRPEWNDANNALVGHGLSVVTVAYLRRYLDHVQTLLTSDGHDVEVSAELATFVHRVIEALRDARQHVAAEDWQTHARHTVEVLGRAAADYRSEVYAQKYAGRSVLAAADVADLLTLALELCDLTLEANRRSDGLFHAYNSMAMTDHQVVVERLPLMLEGQVAVLASGALDSGDALSLLVALRSSPLYRADQHSYQLYPDVPTTPFMDRNILPERAGGLGLVIELLSRGDRSLVTRDGRGGLHFVAGLRNAKDLHAALDLIASQAELAGLVATDRAALGEVFEEVFDHATFIGRSGSFFAFEGLGSIYWHMVSKLLLGVQRAALATSSPDADLVAAYEDVRQGLGYCKDPATYGAFPTDPYSHTPAGRGAKQPGMTGQVKEEVITRFAEMGVRVADGVALLDPRLVRETEWLAEPSVFDYVDVHGAPARIEVNADAFAFTWCQVPIVVMRGGERGWEVQARDGQVTRIPGDVLPREVTVELFGRTGALVSITAYLDLAAEASS